MSLIIVYCEVEYFVGDNGGAVGVDVQLLYSYSIYTYKGVGFNRKPYVTYIPNP
jgi:hypothetical protein